MTLDPKTAEFPTHIYSFEAAVVDFKIGQAIRQVREAKGLTQTQLGELVGVQKARICSIEKGANMRLSTLRRILKALDMNATLLISPDPEIKITIC